jgi:hypothetical protein
MKVMSLKCKINLKHFLKNYCFGIGYLKTKNFLLGYGLIPSTSTFGISKNALK